MYKVIRKAYNFQHFLIIWKMNSLNSELKSNTSLLWWILSQLNPFYYILDFFVIQFAVVVVVIAPRDRNIKFITNVSEKKMNDFLYIPLYFFIVSVCVFYPSLINYFFCVYFAIVIYALVLLYQTEITNNENYQLKIGSVETGVKTKTRRIFFVCYDKHF